MTFTEASTATAAPRSSARADRAAYDLKRTTDWLDEQIAAGKKKAHSSVVTITPTLAQLLLERNPINRPISKRNAADLASDIASGRFEFNGESIVISNTGTLIDGQHRLAQVIATGACIESVLVFGPKEAARFTIDTGRSKTIGNFLAMKGQTYTNILGPAVGFILQWKEHGRISTGGDQARPTKAQIIAAVDELRGIDESVAFTAAAMKNIRSHAVLAFAHYVLWKRSSREAADRFMTKLFEGDELKRTDPILYCRERLRRMGRESMANARAELVFKCWNAHRRGEQIDKIVIVGGKLPKVEK
jgi:hypothetical protein